MGYYSDTKRKLEKLRRTRKKSHSKAFVMDSYMYEDQLVNDLRNLRSGKL